MSGDPRISTNMSTDDSVLLASGKGQLEAQDRIQEAMDEIST